MNILITEATGFIDRHLLQCMQRDHHTIKVLSRNDTHASQILKLALGEAAALTLNDYHIVPKRLLEEFKF